MGSYVGNELLEPAGGPVLIIGAGCTGLSLAQGLKKAGIKSIVFEREPANLQRARDWNFGTHWGIPILKTLIPPEAFAKLDSAQVDPNRPCPPSEPIRFLHGQTGEQIGEAVTPHLYRLRRSKLRALIADGIDIQYGKELSNITYSEDGTVVTAHFADGSNTNGSVLVGADGTRSVVRNLLLGPEKAALTVLEFAASIVQAKYTAEQVKFLRSWHPLFVAAPHPEGYMAWVGLHAAPDADDPENWIMNHYISWHCTHAEQERTKDWTNEQRLKQVKGFAEKFCDPFKSAYGWLKDDHPVWYAPLTQWDPSLPEHRWENHGGRVTLAGDAAHPMTFQRGQGLNSAIKDASELLAQITDIVHSKKTRQEAIEAYEKEMIERTGMEVKLSAENTRMVHVWAEVKQSPLFSKGFSKQ
ncbi:related to monooxygenase [Phialocephala subalpina]|uniref:Related to monooxygenase n=1 Tax=Phialocephala subalpina TaxID=576137 RepID=A0A1L7XLW6_9HELO|nr:related to monooxygenase [Phialocephala subalpina]